KANLSRSERRQSSCGHVRSSGPSMHHARQPRGLAILVAFASLLALGLGALAAGKAKQPRFLLTLRRRRAPKRDTGSPNAYRVRSRHFVFEWAGPDAGGTKRCARG